MLGLLNVASKRLVESRMKDAKNKLALKKCCRLRDILEKQSCQPERL